jgi:hypothetical protein
MIARFLTNSITNLSSQKAQLIAFAYAEMKAQSRAEMRCGLLVFDALRVRVRRYLRNRNFCRGKAEFLPSNFYTSKLINIDYF